MRTVDLVTTEDVRAHMLGTLETIAGKRHNIDVSDRHLVYGSDPFSDPDNYSRAVFVAEECPVCIARGCLEQIGEAERHGLL